MSIFGGKRKEILSGMIGNGLEWYDYALYGHMSIVFSQLFFAQDQKNSLILTFLIFATGFISRPAGAIFFGMVGDKWGRKKALTLSMMMMAVPTACIGLLPTYAQIGIAAPILLLIIRLLQGISMGGAYSGSISYVVEHAPADKRSTVGSVIKLSLVLGFLAGSLVSSLVASLVTEEQFYSWGWRLPFIAGVAIGLVGYYIRHNGEESPVYEQAKKDGSLSKSPVRDVFKHHPKKMLMAFTSYLFVTMPFYTVAIYMIAFSKKHLGLTESDALLANAISMCAMLVLIFPAARMADRYGRRTVLIAAIFAMMIALYPCFMLMQTGDFTNIVIGQCILTMIVGWYLAPMPALLVEIFPTSVRYTGMSLSYNICAIIGGLTPAIAESLIEYTQAPISILWIVVGAGVCSFIALFLYQDRWREPLQAA